jgi:hypothetical protein
MATGKSEFLFNSNARFTHGRKIARFQDRESITRPGRELFASQIDLADFAEKDRLCGEDFEAELMRHPYQLKTDFPESPSRCEPSGTPSFPVGIAVTIVRDVNMDPLIQFCRSQSMDGLGQ